MCIITYVFIHRQQNIVKRINLEIAQSIKGELTSKNRETIRSKGNLVTTHKNLKSTHVAFLTTSTATLQNSGQIFTCQLQN